MTQALCLYLRGYIRATEIFMRKLLSLTLALGTVSVMEAGGFVVVSGVTETSTQVMPDVGDQGVINQGGAIVVTNMDAVSMEAGSQTVLNSGTVTVTDQVGGHYEGIKSIADSASITNKGKITITDQGGGNNAAITTTHTRVVVVNNGTITVVDKGSGGDFGIASSGSDAKIINTGTLSITDQGGGNDHAIESTGDRAVITNRGNIAVLDVQGHSNDYAIVSTGSDVLIINEGTIQGADATLYLTGSSPTFAPALGSVIAGPISTQQPLNLIVAQGENLVLSLQSGGTFGALNIVGPYALSKDAQIAVVDPTGFAMQADTTADLSDTILSGIYLHHTGDPACSCGVWVQGIGSYRARDHQAQTLRYTDWVAGILAGCEMALGKNMLSFFGGYSYAQPTIELSPQQANVNLGYAGMAYQRLFSNKFLGLAAAGGYVNWNNSRNVMNNLAPGGSEEAEVTTGGGFVTAEVTYARSVPPIFYSPCWLNLTLRYAGLFLGNYTEHGSLADLTVENRTVGLLTTRAEFAVVPKPCGIYLAPFIGVFGRYQVQGSCVHSVLLGEVCDFTQGGPLNLVAGCLGIRGVRTWGPVDTFCNLEVSFDSAGSERVLGGIGCTY